jgi:Bacterial regulatory proteins, luxR family
MEIVKLAGSGLTDKEISARIGLSLGTLRTHWDRLRTRFDAKTRTEVIAKVFGSIRSPNLSTHVIKMLPLYIWTADDKGQTKFCNDWLAFRGRSTGVWNTEDGIVPLLDREDRDRFEEAWSVCLRQGREFELMVKVRVGREAGSKPHKLRAIPRLLPDGSVRDWVCYARLISRDADETMVDFLFNLLQEQAAASPPEIVTSAS